MSRVFFNSEKQIYDYISRQQLIEQELHKPKNFINEDKPLFTPIQSYTAPNDVMMAKYSWNGQMGSLSYKQDTSKRTDPVMLNKYGEDYEEGRNSSLINTVNKKPILVSSYYVDNAHSYRAPAGATKPTFLIK